LIMVSCPVKINVRITCTIAQFPLQVFVFTDTTLTSIYNFQVRHPRCVEYKLNLYIYIYIYICNAQLHILLDYIRL